MAARLHGELDAVLGGDPPRSDKVEALDYTTRVIKEPMRLYPPVWAIGREVVSELVVRGYRLPPGAQVVASQWIVHRDPRWYPDPRRSIRIAGCRSEPGICRALLTSRSGSGRGCALAITLP